MEQRDVNSTVQVLYPLGAATADMIFPIPKWAERNFTDTYLGTPAETGLTVFTAILMFISVALLVFLLFNYSNPWIFASSPVFLAFILLGSLIQYSTVFAWARQANTASCTIRYWLLVLGFVVMFGALFAKTYRVMKIFTQKKLVIGLKITNKEVGLILAVAVAIAVILLAIWTGTARPAVTYGVFDPARPAYTIYTCTYTTADTIFLILIMVYIGLLIISGIFMSVRIWNIPSKVFNEAKQIGFSMYNMFFFLVICFGLQISNAISPDAMFILRSLCIDLSTFITIVVIFGPKMKAVIQKKQYQSTNTSSAMVTRSQVSVLSVSNTSSNSDSSTKNSETNARLGKTQKELDKTKKELNELKQKYKRLVEKTGVTGSETEESSSEEPQPKKKTPSKPVKPAVEDSVSTEPSEAEPAKPAPEPAKDGSESSDEEPEEAPAPKKTPKKAKKTDGLGKKSKKSDKPAKKTKSAKKTTKEDDSSSSDDA